MSVAAANNITRVFFIVQSPGVLFASSQRKVTKRLYLDNTAEPPPWSDQRLFAFIGGQYIPPGTSQY